MTDDGAAPCRAERMLWYMHQGHSLETAARLAHVRNQTALEIASIAMGVKTLIRDQESRTQRNAAFNKVLAHDDDHMVATWDAHIVGWRH